jgi:CRISPR/Cas system-associated exonuclease Cas4 (RecB family)
MLKEILDKYCLDREKGKKREQTTFYLSEAGKCGRSIFFKFKKAPAKEKEAHFLRLFEHGEHMHQLIMNALVSTRDIHVVASEVDIPPQQLVRGRADAILSDKKQLYVLDIKSMNSMVFRSMLEAKPENIDQLQLYLHYFEIPKGILLYVNKDNLDLKEYIFDYDKNRAEFLLEGLSNLREKIDSNILPKRIQGYPDDWQCRFCGYKEICDKADPSEMAWNEFKNRVLGN